MGPLIALDINDDGQDVVSDGLTWSGPGFLVKTTNAAANVNIVAILSPYPFLIGPSLCLTNANPIAQLEINRTDTRY